LPVFVIFFLYDWHSDFGWHGITMSFWFTFPLWVRMVNISSCFYWAFSFENCFLVFNYLSFFFFFNLHHWGLKSELTPWATSPALFVLGIFEIGSP
jgi:hypothetical protein